jgi:hypothetical protein
MKIPYVICAKRNTYLNEGAKIAVSRVKFLCQIIHRLDDIDFVKEKFKEYDDTIIDSKHPEDKTNATLLCYADNYGDDSGDDADDEDNTLTDYFYLPSEKYKVDFLDDYQYLSSDSDENSVFEPS